MSLARAYEIIRFGQTIIPADPVEKLGEISEEKSGKSKLADSSYRIIVKLPEEKNISISQEESTAHGPIIEFQGQAIYPNSIVYLEINSDKIITSTMSDGNGEWKWTNHAEPLKNGEHTLEMYNISPYAISGKRDIYVEKYGFTVKSAANASYFPQKLALSGLAIPYKEQMGDDDLGDKLASGESISAYIFQVIFPLKKVFDPGETIRIQLLFEALKKSSARDAEIKYEIFRYADDSLFTEKVSELSDVVRLEEENSFVKFIQLKDRLVGGDYVFKITSFIAGERYIQTQRFSIAEKEVIKVGSLTVTEERMTQVLVWNIFIILLIIIILAVTIALEYRRFLRCTPIDEDFLKQKRFFS